MFVARALTFALVALFCLVVPPVASEAPSDHPLTVMTFNIRYGTADDGANRWSARRRMVFEVIRKEDPDVLGLQEALDGQIHEIVTALPGYAVVGVGRDDAAEKGEYSAILFRRSRLRVASAGTFWFSDTPDVPGSTSWGNRITRICTWARFVDHDGRAFWHFNVHLDHESQSSRERSTALLRERIERRRPGDEPVIVTGDFNAGETNAALSTLLANSPGADPLLVDTYRVLHPQEQMVGTYTAFEFGKTNGDKIDYVLVRPGTKVLRADIVRWGRNKRYPSDHFPVVASVRL